MDAALPAEAMYAGDKAAQWLGVVVEEAQPGLARLSMPVRSEMTNSAGVCHGGLIFALADTAMAYAANAGNAASLAQYASITFVSPGRSGECLTATAEEQSRTGRTALYDVRVAGEDGRTVALFRGGLVRVGGKVVEGMEVVE